MELIKSDVWKPHCREETGVSDITLDLPIIKTCHYFTGVGLIIQDLVSFCLHFPGLAEPSEQFRTVSVSRLQLLARAEL